MHVSSADIDSVVYIVSAETTMSNVWASPREDSSCPSSPQSPEKYRGGATATCKRRQTYEVQGLHHNQHPTFPAAPLYANGAAIWQLSS